MEGSCSKSDHRRTTRCTLQVLFKKIVIWQQVGEVGKHVKKAATNESFQDCCGAVFTKVLENLKIAAQLH